MSHRADPAAAAPEAAPVVDEPVAARIRLWSRAALGALAAGTLLGAVTAEHAGGDYACFWAAGRQVLAGASPYDGDAMAALQRPLVAGGEWLPFAWPPVAALAHAALAVLPYRAAFAVHAAAAGACAVAIPRVLAPIAPRAARHPELAALALLAWPGFRGLVGGQATLVLALGVAAVVRCLHDRRPLAAGLVAGAVAIKPTLGVPLAGLAALAGGRWAAAGAAASLGALWALSALVEGPGWLGRWWAVAWAFQAEAQRVEGPWNVGLLGAAEHALGYGTPAARGVGGLLAAGCGAVCAAAWARGGPLARLATAGALLPLLPPHAIWYDATLAGLAVLVLGEVGGPTEAALAWIALGAVAATGALGFQPLVLVLPALAAAALRPR